MTKPAGRTIRVFKTAWFVKAAAKAGIDDADLCKAVNQAVSGQADDLGGGVFKKRLNKNLHRGIVLAKGGHIWTFAYLFAKKDRDNIDDDELEDFRKLAKGYEGLTDRQLAQLLRDEDLNEICNENFRA
jgi:hypothetical protein